MSKLRSDSTWAALSSTQNETLTDWLFEEKLSYTKTLERIQKEFGITASRSSLSRYYQILERERLRDEILASQETAAELQGAKGDSTVLTAAAIKIVGNKLINCALKQGKTKEITSLTSLLLQNEQQNIQREWLALARERFEFKAAKATLKARPVMDEMTRDDEAREHARVEAIKLKIFGKELLDSVEFPPSCKPF